MPIVINSEKHRLFVNKIGNVLNSPEQRLILGATALATQPFIDFYNRSADEETRAVSTARTIGKIVAGTLCFNPLWRNQRLQTLCAIQPKS